MRAGCPVCGQPISVPLVELLPSRRPRLDYVCSSCQRPCTVSRKTRVAAFAGLLVGVAAAVGLLAFVSWSPEVKIVLAWLGGAVGMLVGGAVFMCLDPRDRSA
jgi:hypothetical protein